MVALKSLMPACLFNVVGFGSTFKTVFASSQIYNEVRRGKSGPGWMMGSGEQEGEGNSKGVTLGTATEAACLRLADAFRSLLPLTVKSVRSWIWRVGTKDRDTSCPWPATHHSPYLLRIMGSSKAELQK